jgi:drug/metabolite transporter (DMT)-like permease
MAHVGPFTFNAVRFGLGCLVLLPWLGRFRRRALAAAPRAISRTDLLRGLLSGVVLFGGASLQQAGIVFTTAGKAGFITGLYVLIVPLLGLLWGHRPGTGTWLGAVLATVGLYFLSVTGDLRVARGDLLVLLGAVFWAVHVLVVAWILRRGTEALTLAVLQFAVCSLLSGATALVVEEIAWTGIRGAALPILYSGILSVGIAYTLQIFGQKHAPPAHAAIILSLEAVFAALGGWWLLQEVLSARDLLGCALMLGGILVSQVRLKSRQSRAKAA